MTPTDDDMLTERLHKSFVAGVNWPVDAASLAALADIGLGDGEIAAYFGVTAAEVAELRRRYAAAVRKRAK
ncbi:hypothetical protein [Minwuia thermotolerans]|uniref:Uncharacterized protein n=1 Tax=Minwuia thermotolerans TaxID=2056226 RepID=A0A2M9FVE9_9PROT|nr:hypothetical protein [Minwuia thermotolerans]PJK27450.1 hypothetical protein CVT23_21230 [Minwuia thermotolerans]